MIIDALTIGKEELQELVRKGMVGFVKAYRRVHGDGAKISAVEAELPNAYKLICLVCSLKTRRDYGMTIRNNMRYLTKLQAHYLNLGKDEESVAAYPDGYDSDICAELVKAIIEELENSLSGYVVQGWDVLLMQSYSYAVADLIQDGYPQKFRLAAAYARLPMEIFAADADDLGFDAWQTQKM